jgi:signal transduction histidine kinase
MTTRVDRRPADGIYAGVVRPTTLADAVPVPVRAQDVERLIGERPVRWWTLAGTWLAAAFSVAICLYVNFEAQGVASTFPGVLMALIPHYLFWVLVSPPLYRALHRTIQGPNRVLWTSTLAAWSGIALGGSTAVSFFNYVIRHDLKSTFEQLYDVYFAGPAGPAYWVMNFSILAIALMAFAAVRSHRLRLAAMWEAAQTELRGARLEAQLADARLLALQSQINPHFLLNSLNAIASLVQVGERDRAFDAIGRLGELLRMAIRSGSDLNLTLGDEMDFLQSYLQLCKLRFDQQFQYCVSMPASLGGRRVPALIVQPLIENSIRHGMESSRPLNVDVRAYARGTDLVIEVEDDGRGIRPDAAALLPLGHGLANVAERLRLFFGGSGVLSLEPRAPRGTLARIVIGG